MPHGIFVKIYPLCRGLAQLGPAQCGIFVVILIDFTGGSTAAGRQLRLVITALSNAVLLISVSVDAGSS